MGLPEAQIAERTSSDSREDEQLVLFPENCTPVMLFHQAASYWSWVSTGTGSIRISLDWPRLMAVTLLDVPKVFARPDLKGRKKRLRYIIEGIEVMEQAALAVFFQEEGERQDARKRGQKQVKAKQIATAR